MKLTFVLNGCDDMEKAGDLVTNYLSALRMNGQIPGKEYPILYKNNMISRMFLSRNIIHWIANTQTNMY
jgi:predicted  nucleic acid-binding Zn ribbon protein